MSDKQTTLDLFSENFNVLDEIEELTNELKGFEIDGEVVNNDEEIITSENESEEKSETDQILKNNEVEKEHILTPQDIVFKPSNNIEEEKLEDIEDTIGVGEQEFTDQISDFTQKEDVEEIKINFDDVDTFINEVEYGRVNIMVIGIGGCGCNAINRMYNDDFTDIKLVAVDTSQQTLDNISADYKMLIGEPDLHGHGSGGNTLKAEKAFVDSKERIRNMLKGIDMVFLAGGIGRGTGSVGLVEVGKIAREMDILTIGFATLPREMEANGEVVQKYYPQFIESVDSNIVVENEKISKIATGLPILEAMKLADSMLVEGIRGIFELITKPGKINLDYADIKTAFSDQGSSIMGIGKGKGEDAVLRAIQEAIHSDIANVESVKNAKTIIFNITCSPRSVTIDEASRGSDLIYSFGHRDNIDHLLFGYSYDDDLDDEVKVTFIATGTTPTQISYDVFNDKPQTFVFKPSTNSEAKKSIFEDLSGSNTVEEKISTEEKEEIEIPDFFKK